MEESRDRLHELLQLNSTILAAPLLVLSSYGLEETSSGLGLQQLLSSGLVAHYNVVQVTPGLFNIDQIVRINQSIRHLINLAPQDLAPGFAQSSFTDFVEDFFVGKIFSAFFANLAARRAEDLPHRSAADLVGLFNAGLDHLAATLQDPVLAEVIWPPQLCPETPADTASLLTCLERLRLPELVVHDCDSWRNIVDRVLVYLNQRDGVRVAAAAGAELPQLHLAVSERDAGERGHEPPPGAAAHPAAALDGPGAQLGHLPAVEALSLALHCPGRDSSPWHRGPCVVPGLDPGVLEPAALLDPGPGSVRSQGLLWRRRSLRPVRHRHHQRLHRRSKRQKPRGGRYHLRECLHQPHPRESDKGGAAVKLKV